MRIVPCGTITCSPQSPLSCAKKPETTNPPTKPTSAHSPAPVAPPNVPSSKANSGGWQKRDEQRRRGREKRREGETGRRRRGALPLPNRPFAVNGFTYDAAGNLTNDGGQSFSYDATGQQATASYSGYILQQTYDGERLRVKKVENGATTYYLRSTVLGGQIVAELNSAGSWTRGFVYLGGQLLAVQQNNQVSWVHQDPFVKSKRVTDSA